MKIQLVTKPLSEIKTDFIVFPIFENGVTNVKNELIAEFLKDNPKFGNPLESQLIYSKFGKLLLLGCGKKDKFHFEAFQNWVGTAVKLLSKKAKQISIILAVNGNFTADEVGKAVAIGAELALYDPAESYKSEFEKNKLTTLEVIVERAEKGYQDGIKEGQAIAEGINLARRLGDMPPNEMTPTYFLNVVRKIAKENKLKLLALDEKMAKRKGMGGFVGVAQGSSEPSYMISLEYKGDLRSKEKWGLIGKGITFDSGGISIKPSEMMHEMKYDMTGATSVLATLILIAKLGLKTNAVGIMAVTENMPGGGAQKPGDIVKTYSGKTAEVINTDAEGRMVLIDGVSYAQKDFKATKLVDIATLTGGIIVAIGEFITGAMGNDPKFTEQLIAAGASVGERFWELPMDDEFNDMIKSDMADINNVGGRGYSPRSGHAIMGAKFIEAGVEPDIPWIHLDIGGTAMDMRGKPYRAIGATGVSVKTLVKLIQG